MRSEDDAVCRDARPAASDERPRRINPRRVEQPADIIDRLEAPIFPVDQGEGKVAGARRVAGSDAGSWIGFRPLETRLPSSIDPGRPVAGKQLLLGHDLVAGNSIELYRARPSLAAFRRSTLRQPFLKAPIEDGDLPGSEMPEHEPATRRRTDWRIVVDDDAIVATDTEPLHRRTEV